MKTLWLSAALFSYGQKAQAVQVLEEDVKAQPFHLSSLLQLAWTRSQVLSRDNQTLWAGRKDVQLILSRLEQYEKRGLLNPAQWEFEGQLGLDMRQSASELKAEANKLLQQIESRLGQATQ